MTNNIYPSNEHDHTPPDLLEMRDAVDRLAGSERLAADAGLEARVFRSSLPALRSAGGAPRAIRFPSAGWWRLAAGVALLAGVGLMVSMWLTSRATPGVWTAATTPAPIAENTANGDDTIDTDRLRDELDDFLASYDAVERADLADSTPMTQTFWDSDGGLSSEEPIQ
ncbi:MAG: hypothetical protein JNK58_14140 [Phycisphaerae bacterium]|nr:hypothetical protein [Phycisphaerae bacterium]